MEKEEEIEQLRTEIKLLKQKVASVSSSSPKKELKFKIGAKKGLSISGLSQRFPVTLYKKDWKYLLQTKNVEKILKFIDENEDELK